MLDRTHPWLVYECSDGSYEVINGNHRKILFERNPGSPSTWPCRVIPKEEVNLQYFHFSYFQHLSASAIRKLAEYTNDEHDSRCIHATYFEKLGHVQEVLPLHMHGKSVNWKNLKKEFIGTWYQSEQNLRKAVTLIKALQNKPNVSYYDYFT